MNEKTTKELYDMFNNQQNNITYMNVDEYNMKYVYTKEKTFSGNVYLFEPCYGKIYKNVRINIPKENIDFINITYGFYQKETIYYSLYDLCMKVHNLTPILNDFDIIPSFLSKGFPSSWLNDIRMVIYLYDKSSTDKSSEITIRYDIYEEFEFTTKDVYNFVDDSIPDELVHMIHNYIPILDFCKQSTFPIHRVNNSHDYNLPIKFMILMSNKDIADFDKLDIVFNGIFTHTFTLI